VAAPFLGPEVFEVKAVYPRAAEAVVVVADKNSCDLEVDQHAVPAMNYLVQTSSSNPSDFQEVKCRVAAERHQVQSVLQISLVACALGTSVGLLVTSAVPRVLAAGPKMVEEAAGSRLASVMASIHQLTGVACEYQSSLEEACDWMMGVAYGPCPERAVVASDQAACHQVPTVGILALVAQQKHHSASLLAAWVSSVGVQHYQMVVPTVPEECHLLAADLHSVLVLEALGQVDQLEVHQPDSQESLVMAGHIHEKVGRS
jgi:hypothetical protein